MTVRTVLVDTNVFTAILRPDSPLTSKYAKYLVGARMAITAQTVMEARYGALNGCLGRRRVEELKRVIARSRTLSIDDKTVWAAARLRHRCKIEGHPLHQKQHMGDLWIAATALRWSLPLVAHDAIFGCCPGLDLRTELRDRA